MVLICLPDFYLDVPCGRCHECQKRRMRDYAIRLLYELSEYPNSYFVTLTFNEEKLAKWKDNPNKAVLMFLDRFRKAVNDNKQIKHWFVAEFGSLHGRIHYHGFLFNLDFDKLSPDELQDLFEKYWGNGYVSVSKVQSDGAARYVSKYVTKSYSDGYSNPPRIISSVGIGKSYLTDDNIKWHKDSSGYLRPYILKGGYKISLPRYYAEKVFTGFDKAMLSFQRFLDKEEGSTEYIWKGVKYPDEISFINARNSDFKANCRLGLSKPYTKQKINNQNLLNNYGKFSNSCGLPEESKEIRV